MIVIYAMQHGRDEHAKYIDKSHRSGTRTDDQVVGLERVVVVGGCNVGVLKILSNAK
jgi:hypothetical protein